MKKKETGKEAQEPGKDSISKEAWENFDKAMDKVLKGAKDKPKPKK